MKRIALCIMLMACGARQTQSVLTKTAELTLVETTELRSGYHTLRDISCRQRFPPEQYEFEDWRSCMEPSYKLDKAVAVADDLLRAAQHALNSSGEQGVKAMAPHLLQASQELLSTMRELGLGVPKEVDDIIRVMRMFL